MEQVTRTERLRRGIVPLLFSLGLRRERRRVDSLIFGHENPRVRYAAAVARVRLEEAARGFKRLAAELAR